jgi:hypothetical protein
LSRSLRARLRIAELPVRLSAEANAPPIGSFAAQTLV